MSKHVEILCINNPIERQRFESLLNDPEVKIEDVQKNFDVKGSMNIYVMWSDIIPKGVWQVKHTEEEYPKLSDMPEDGKM